MHIKHQSITIIHIFLKFSVVKVFPNTKSLIAQLALFDVSIGDVQDSNPPLA